MSLFDHRILVVTGKGGVGKTTLCATLGLLAARRGRRTLITETSGSRSIPPLFGKESRGYEPVELIPGLETLSITPLEAIEDYVVQQIKVRRLYELVFKNRVMAPFVDAVPGLHDAVQLGKVWDCAVQARDAAGQPRWDLVIVDAPATGHGLTMLDAPRSMMELTRAGPMFRGNQKVELVLGDPIQTRLLLVCLPEEMPVAETIDLHQRLGERRAQASLVVLNEALSPPPITAEEWATLRGALPVGEEPLALVEDGLRRFQRQERLEQRLRQAIDLPLVKLPFLFRRDLGPSDLARLASALELDGGLR